MANKLPLDTLIELAKDKNDEATRKFGLLQTAHTTAAKKLDILMEYRSDYIKKFDLQLAKGVPSFELRNFQAFICTLDGAIEEQRLFTKITNTRLDTGRGDWQHSKRRLNSFNTLADRVRQQELVIINKREQRDSDEHTARQFNLRERSAP